MVEPTVENGSEKVNRRREVEVFADTKQAELPSTPEKDLIDDEVDEEPELHFRTYIALAAMFLLNLVQVFALQGPPAVVRCLSLATCKT